jgi:hypothetical protein
MTDPITLERLVRELESLRREMDAGNLEHGEYDQRLARVITELRERKLDADRTRLGATLDELLQRGVTTPAVDAHLRRRLGL